MSWHLHTTVYELKGNLSRFLRALARGDTDYVIISRYDKKVAMMVPIGKKYPGPALEPENADDVTMRARTVWFQSDSPSRRPPLIPDIF